MAQHEHGTTDISAQQATFHGFLRLLGIGFAVAIGVLIFAALANA